MRLALLVERGPAPELQPFLDFYAREIRTALLLLDDEERTAELAQAPLLVGVRGGLDNDQFLAWVAERGNASG